MGHRWQMMSERLTGPQECGEGLAFTLNSIFHKRATNIICSSPALLFPRDCCRYLNSSLPKGKISTYRVEARCRISGSALTAVQKVPRELFASRNCFLGPWALLILKTYSSLRSKFPCWL